MRKIRGFISFEFEVHASRPRAGQAWRGRAGMHAQEQAGCVEQGRSAGRQMAKIQEGTRRAQHLSTEADHAGSAHGSGGGRTRRTRAGTEEQEPIRACTRGCREGMQPGLAMPRPDAGLRSRTFPRAARTGGAAGGTPSPCSLRGSAEVAGRAGVKQEAFVPAGAHAQRRKHGPIIRPGYVPWAPTVGLCLGSYGAPREGAFSYERGNPVGRT